MIGVKWRFCNVLVQRLCRDKASRSMPSPYLYILVQISGSNEGVLHKCRESKGFLPIEVSEDQIYSI